MQLILADGSIYPHEGHFALADRQVDPTTGTLKVGALFPNPDNQLRPGGFAIVRALMSVQKGALLIPQRAVTEIQGKYLVAVVGSGQQGGYPSGESGAGSVPTGSLRRIAAR